MYSSIFLINKTKRQEILKLFENYQNDPKQPLVIPAGVQVLPHNFTQEQYEKAVGVFSAEPTTDGEKRFEKALERKGYVNINKCPYCGNTSQERDKRGNCISCGGAR